MVVLVADQNGLTRPSHAMFVVVFFESLQAREHRWILLRLAILGAECVVAERVQADSLGLVRIEVLGKDGAVQCQLFETLISGPHTDRSSAKRSALLSTCCLLICSSNSLGSFSTIVQQAPYTALTGVRS